ncbi:MAG: hypothetical protein AB7J13_16700 [Pyrinomonadaceae bacterium]
MELQRASKVFTAKSPESPHDAALTLLLKLRNLQNVLLDPR